MNHDNLKKIIDITKSLNTLYIEDNNDVRNQTLKMLNIFFENIIVATNGNEGLSLFKSKNKFESSSFDLIITDIEMPVKDGITMINQIREIDKEIPILIFSAHSNTEYFLQTIDAGIDGYILKPYSIDQISNSLSKIIEKNKLKTINNHIINLENDFLWNTEDSLLFKDEEEIKLTKSEIKLFTLFISTKGSLKTYDEIENYIFDEYSTSSKRVRNLMSRLKQKLDYELFESIYGHGYKLKYKKIL
ncbi:response regulator transcription factor [Arcobacter arenosus]|jgi:DNA-binding response OmpR family regulator|uniref:Response regulator transcription factor n=1 Tax=Arcobacter arenosus TaxID=2576037 RepID=A0A5R8XXE9_9BACT|nr:response regulator transcription factor [Arcobacter arenosus]TLP35755.1 response regulator transcription factor [Arcobacter arenosus]